MRQRIKDAMTAPFGDDDDDNDYLFPEPRGFVVGYKSYDLDSKGVAVPTAMQEEVTSNDAMNKLLSPVAAAVLKDDDLWKTSSVRHVELVPEISKKRRGKTQFPKMPLMPIMDTDGKTHSHPKVFGGDPTTGLLMVAKLVPHGQVRSIPAARHAVGEEWGKLEARTCWDPTTAAPWEEVKQKVVGKVDANGRAVIIHLGALCELCYLKGSELEPGHPNRKYKGRVVFLGNSVKDQFGAAAVFEGMSASPAGIEASRFCDMYGMLQGNPAQVADAEQAYTQALLKGTETWIVVPPHLRDPKWPKGVKYVMKLDKALYGHPQSGFFWEQQCEEAIFEAGFKTIGDCGEWRSC